MDVLQGVLHPRPLPVGPGGRSLCGKLIAGLINVLRHDYFPQPSVNRFTSSTTLRGMALSAGMARTIWSMKLCSVHGTPLLLNSRPEIEALSPSKSTGSAPPDSPAGRGGRGRGKATTPGFCQLMT